MHYTLWNIRKYIKGGENDYEKKRKEIAKYVLKIVDLMERGILEGHHLKYGGNNRIWGFFLFRKENEIRKLVAYFFMYSYYFGLKIKFNINYLLPLLRFNSSEKKGGKKWK